MDLINPFEPFGKADTVPPQHATILRALVKTGANLGHGLDLTVVRHSGHGGRRPGLEHYGRKGVSKSVARGLAQIAAMPKPSSVPAPGRTAGRLLRANRLQASKAPARNEAMAQLRTKLNFGDASSKGRRVV